MAEIVAPGDATQSLTDISNEGCSSFRMRYRKVPLTVQETSYVSQSVQSSAHMKFTKVAASKISPVLDSFNAESCQEGAALDNPERCPLNDRLPDKANVSGKYAFTTFAGQFRITDS